MEAIVFGRSLGFLKTYPVLKKNREETRFPGRLRQTF
jgi:hypothetical protein